MSEKEIMSEEAMNELINGFEIVGSLTEYGRKNIKYHFQRLQEENQELKEELHKASIEMQEMIEQDIECPSNCSKLNELKKQLEICYCNRTDCSGRIKDSKQYDSLVQRVENQQKEFIEYLENEINKIKEQIRNYDIWHEVGVDINFLILKKQFFIEILSKYKEIIGVSNENNT